MKNKLIKHWPLFVLILIFLFSFYIRSINIRPDQIVHFDPIFQLRFTQYIVNWGHLPLWDELSYYVGRANTPTDSPFLWYLTAWLFMILKMFGSTMSLTTTATYMGALYGALAVFPAYFLVKELSNEYGGLLGASLIATAPQILIRTFGGSFDTDQLVVFFILASLYALMIALRKKSIASVSFAILILLAFLMTWGMFIYPIAIAGAVVVMAFVFSYFFKKKNESGEALIKEHSSKFMKGVGLLVGIYAILFVLGTFLKRDVLGSLLYLFGFVLKPETYIVNISIAELQPFNIFNLAGWTTALGNFVSGNMLIDSSLLVAFMILIAASIYIPFKNKKLKDISIVIALIAVAVYTTFRGIRFTEFSSVLFLIVIAIGFGKVTEFVKDKNITIRNGILGIGLLIAFLAVTIGLQLGSNLGPDSPENWMDAWEFFETQTPELSIVGTWWDPGHMIAGIAERRNIADGAHCKVEDCLYDINDRITDLGKIMATTDEEESIRLINKYKGNSPKAYWIASGDLIGKFQWCQYFGTGCDARSDPNCELYLQIPKTNLLSSGTQVVANQYGNVLVLKNFNFPVPLIVQNRISGLPREVMFYEGNEVKTIVIDQELKEEMLTQLKPSEEMFGIRLGEDIYEYSIWIEKEENYVVLVPPRLREAVFTKMFMLEGEGLEHFKQVFRNEEVKIYEVIF